MKKIGTASPTLIVIVIVAVFVTLANFASSPRVGIDWAHHRFMLPPGTELPSLPRVPPGGEDVWYETPPQKRWIKG
jgi:hypothetical protein